LVLEALFFNKSPYLTTAQDEVYGFLNVDITNNNNDGTTMLVSTFYSKEGGEMTDQFTIAKSAEGDLSLSPPSPPPELPAQEETDILDEVDDGVVGFDDDDDALVSEDSEDVVAGPEEEDAAEDEGHEEDEESDDDDDDDGDN
jgi:hypothetical protein